LVSYYNINYYTMRKTKIPLVKRYKKYGWGGTEKPTSEDTMYSGSGVKPNMLNMGAGDMNAGQYAAAAGSIAMGAGQAIQANNNDSLNELEKANGINKGIDNAGIGVTTAINPILGGLVAGGKKVGDNIRINADRTDEQGNLVNADKSKLGQIGSAIFDPRMGLVESFKDPKATTGQKILNVLTGGAGDAFTSRHKNLVERSAKAPILEQQRLEDQQLALEQKMLKDQQLQANIALNAAYGGKMPRYNMGGINAELEGGENTLAPDGSTTQYEGPSHEQGGIPTNLQPGEMVFSDRLKMPGIKKTFAELNKPNDTTKEDKILSNKNSDNYKRLSAELMKKAKVKQSLALFEAQEGLKQSKLENYAKRLGITGNVMAMGGLPKRDPNSLYDDSSSNEQLSYEDPMINATKFVPTTEDNENTVVPVEQGFVTKPYGYQGIDPTEQQKEYPELKFKDPKAPKDYSKYASIGQGLLQNAGNITSLIMAGKLDKDKYDRVAPEKLGKPNLLDPSQAIRDVNRSYTGLKDTVGSRSGGNAATFLANIQAANANKMNAEARIRKDYDNANTGIKNDFDVRNNEIVNRSKYFNAGTQKEEFIANQMNKGQRRNVVANSISNIGQNVNSQIRDDNADKMDQETLNLIATRYPEMMNDPELAKYFKTKTTKKK